MVTFIQEVLLNLLKEQQDISQLTFILPSKRAGVILKNQLANLTKKPIFLPRIVSIESFVEELSGLQTTSSTELLLEFYLVYCNNTVKEQQESFENFSKWAQVIIQDFNEIDRYLIPQKQLFQYLSAIQDLSHWSVNEPKTEMVSNYLKFWNRLYEYYLKFTNALAEKGIGYQGIIYRAAVDKVNDYISANKEKQHVFLGFNALNTAESELIQRLLENNMAKIFWDIDETFFNHPKHDAALFTREHRKNWTYFKSNPFNWITNNYRTTKNIDILGVPKNVGQAKQIGHILNNLTKTNRKLDKTAVVLGDENLLITVLNSIPSSVNSLNITMGFPLSSVPLATLFEQLLEMHKKGTNSFYHKDVISICSHQFITSLLKNNPDDNNSIIKDIQNNNLVYITIENLKELAPEKTALMNLLFGNWKNDANIAIKTIQEIIWLLKKDLDLQKDRNALPLEYLYRFNEVFNELSRLNTQYGYLKNISALTSVYKELLSRETLDFQGEPLEGLQIMGMLESRVLDFETVIITSVNEGILPAGKTQNSFIPFDVKLENNLPTYKEKDAVYTYHFYRLLQRAKNVYILYNTESDALLGGEKSRFITQLELEGIHNITHKIIPPVVPALENKLTQVDKNNDVIASLNNLALKGISPSAITSYIRNPLDFYYQKVLGIKEYDMVEETVAANTLGSVIHNTLEDFYTPIIGKTLTEENLEKMKAKIPQTVSSHFKTLYKKGDITKGKNLIVFEIAKRYVLNFINKEIEALKKGDSIKIIALEEKLETTLIVEGIDQPVKIHGFVDRIDECNGITRVIDYKTGKVESSQVTVIDWEELMTDYNKYSKPIQILTYALMMESKTHSEKPLEAGIISFKNLNAGFIPFTKKESVRGRKESLITQETLSNFKVQLENILREIYNPEIPFVEKEV